MAKKDIINIEARIKAKKKLRRKKNFKRGAGKLILRLSVLSSIAMALYIYDPEIYIKLTNDIENLISQVTPILESLLQQLPL